MVHRLWPVSTTSLVACSDTVHPESVPGSAASPELADMQARRLHVNPAQRSQGQRTSSRWWLVPLGMLLLAAVLLALRPLMVHSESQSEPSPLSGRVESACEVFLDSHATSNVLLRGEEVQVTSRLQADCNGPLIPLHVVLVLDASRSIAGLPLADARPRPFSTYAT